MMATQSDVDVVGESITGMINGGIVIICRCQKCAIVYNINYTLLEIEGVEEGYSVATVTV